MSQSLVERIGIDPHRDRVVEDCCTLVDAQVKAKGGLSGMGIKAVYATVKTFKRGFVPSVVNAMLDEWLGKLQPYHDKWEAGGAGAFAEFLIARSEDVAEDLLQVTDARAAKSEHGTVKKLYEKNRGTAKKNVIEAVPELARLIEKHLAAAPPAA
ncbi:MAG: hypothetical protein R3B06_09615 [Kofleriaceae bacterium]